MKKLIFVLASALLLASPCAFAQQNNDSMMFNHLSIGANLSPLGNLGVDLSAPIGPKFDVRVGFNTGVITTALTQLMVEGYYSKATASDPVNVKNGVYSFTLKEPYKGNGLDISKISFQPKAHTSNLEVLFDFFPSKKNFHITAGAFFSLNPVLLHAEVAALNAAGGNGIPQSDWANTTIKGISTDKQGKLQMDVKYGLSIVKPYVGVGWGRPVDTEHRVGFVFDMGLYYIGGVHMYSYDFSSGGQKPVELNSAWINNDADLKKAAGAYTEYVDMANGFPILPMIRFNIFIRLF